MKNPKNRLTRSYMERAIERTLEAGWCLRAMSDQVQGLAYYTRSFIDDQTGTCCLVGAIQLGLDPDRTDNRSQIPGMHPHTFLGISEGFEHPHKEPTGSRQGDRYVTGFRLGKQLRRKYYDPAAGSTGSKR